MTTVKLAPAFQGKISFQSVIEAQERIKGFLHTTPVFQNEALNRLCLKNSDDGSSVNVFCKGEFLQKTGSFKARGALNAVLKLKESTAKGETVSGVVTHSSGNHGQALAWAAREAGLPCQVVIPRGAPAVKAQAIESYGATLVYCDPTPAARASTCAAISQRENYDIIPPYDHYDVIAGQGTIALEFLSQVPDLDCILVPISGGGMTSGICIAAKEMKPDIKIYAVEPSGKELGASLKAGQRLWEGEPKFLDTIADGIRLQQVGHLTWPILLELAEKEVLSVTDMEMIESMKFVFQRMKLAIEVSAAAGIAAVQGLQFKALAQRYDFKNVGIILCGGNTDLDKLPWIVH